VVQVDRAEVASYRSETIVWTTGQRPSPLLASLGLPLDGQRRVIVDDHCGVPGHPEVFALGDAAAVPAPEGGTCPPTAQHAVRQAKTAALNAAAHLGIGRPRRFRYRSRGLAVTLGKWNGAAQVRQFTFTGFVAWWMGRSYHLLMMPGIGRKSRVVADWTVALCFPRDVTQLGPPTAPPPLPEPPTPASPAGTTKGQGAASG
jgi:NADH dehydrogenase